MRNQRMRAMHGNTAKDTQLKICTINTNGFSVATKRAFIADSEWDIIGLTETHLQSHLHTAYKESWQQFTCFFFS